MARGIRGMAAAAMPTPQPQVKEYLESNSLLIKHNNKRLQQVINLSQPFFCNDKTKSAAL